MGSSSKYTRILVWTSSYSTDRIPSNLTEQLSTACLPISTHFSEISMSCFNYIFLWSKVLIALMHGMDGPRVGNRLPGFMESGCGGCTHSTVYDSIMWQFKLFMRNINSLHMSVVRSTFAPLVHVHVANGILSCGAGGVYFTPLPVLAIMEVDRD